MITATTIIALFVAALAIAALDMFLVMKVINQKRSNRFCLSFVVVLWVLNFIITGLVFYFLGFRPF